MIFIWKINDDWYDWIIWLRYLFKRKKSFFNENLFRSWYVYCIYASHLWILRQDNFWFNCKYILITPDGNYSRKIIWKLALEQSCRLSSSMSPMSRKRPLDYIKIFTDCTAIWTAAIVGSYLLAWVCIFGIYKYLKMTV